MKIIKFDLPINGAKVRNLEELRDNFTTEIMELQTSGVLIKWAKGRGLMEEADKLSAIPVDLDAADRLVVLCEIFEVDVDRAVIEAALFESSGRQGVPLHVDPEELKYKEKFEQLSKLMDELKRKKLYLTQDDYNRFVKDKIQIENEGKIECLEFSREVLEADSFCLRSMGGIGKGFYSNYEYTFVPHKNLGDVVECGDVIGKIVRTQYNYEIGEPPSILSPLRGVLVKMGDITLKSSVYAGGDPICYIQIDHDTAPTIKIIPD